MKSGAVSGVAIGTLAFALSMGPSASSALAADQAVVEKLEHGEINWTTKTVLATGSGAPNTTLPNVAAVRLAAERAAKMGAYRNILETLKGVRITASETGQGSLDRPQIKTQVEGIIRGCKTVDTRYYSDGGVDVVVQCPLDQGLSAALAPVKAREKLKLEGESKYTGLILDAVGTKVHPALSPRVVGPEGKSVYSKEMVNPNHLRQRGAVSYSRSVEAAKKDPKVGKKPLVLKVSSVGEAPTDLTLTSDEVAKLKGQNLTFLSEARVVIATDGP